MFLKEAGELLTNLGILMAQKDTSYKHMHLCAEGSVKVSQLTCNVSSSNNNKVLWLLVASESLGGGHVRSVLKTRNWRNGWTSSSCDKDAIASKHLVSALKFSFSNKLGWLAIPVNIWILFNVRVDREGFLIDFLCHFGDELLPVDTVDLRVNLKDFGVEDGGSHIGWVNEHLGRDATSIQTCSSQSIHFAQCHLKSQFT
mmetsp:Transcript_1077/g.3662  ORF Transcript_1077/g.3662 Transcript_1077/m.3662 type:complete len:200 (+) Transcript_1077:4934-5533(+)